MADELQLAYQYCQRVAKKQARNFYYAFITLPPQKRRAIYAAYAFCRLCDDIADEDLPLEKKVDMLAQTRSRLSASFDLSPQGPVFAALKDASLAFRIPPEYYVHVIEGVEMDLTWSRYNTFEELRSYCYKVASTVGLICLEVFGYADPQAREHAVDLGIAMQLTNILRDLREDAQRGRIYIPLDEIYSFGYSEEELMQGVLNPPFKELMSFQVERAQRYFDSGRLLLSLLSPRSRACPAVLHGIYSQILHRIETSEYNVFNGRIGLNTREKLLLTAKLWAASLIPRIPLLRAS